MNTKRIKGMLVVSALAVATLIAQQAQAGIMWGWAEGAQLYSSSTCTKVADTPASSAAEFFVECLDGTQSGVWLMPSVVPPDATSVVMTATIVFAVESASTVTCSWDVGHIVYPDDGPILYENTIVGAGVYTLATSGSFTSEFLRLYYTPSTAAFPMYNEFTNAACANVTVDCDKNSYARMWVRFNDSQSAGTAPCRFRAIRYTYS